MTSQLTVASVLAYGFAVLLGPPKLDEEPKMVEKAGMTFEWSFNEEQLEIKMTSPGPGWIAFGFNDQDQIKHSHLVMGSANGASQKVEDHYVVDFGDHRDVASLGGQSHIICSNVSDADARTVFTLKLDSKPKDGYHKALEPGSEWYLTLAYSLSDDFDHHSIKRTSVKVKL